MTNKVMITRLVIVASVTLVVFTALAGLLYIGLVYYRDIFDKLLAMIAPPIFALITWDDHRSKRTRLGLPKKTVSARDWLVAISSIAVYVSIVYLLFERFEMLFLTAPILVVFGGTYWLRLKNQREVKARSN